MIVYIFSLTLQQLLRRRSTLLLIALAAAPVLLAIIFRVSQPNVDAQRWTARVLYVGLIVTAGLPLTALLLGTSVLGDEIEDGTALYLLTKPLPRWQILAPKLAAAWLVTALLVVAATLASGVVALEGHGGTAIIAGFAVASVVGALAYTTLFVLLSIVTNRALIVGLVYVFIWEGAITGIFPGTSYLSVRHFTLGIAHWIAATPPQTFDADLGGETALALVVVTIVAGALFANRKLQQFEVRDSS